MPRTSKPKPLTKPGSTPGLAKPKEAPAYIPTMEESFLNEYWKQLDDLLEAYGYYKLQMSEAKRMIDGEEGTKDTPPVPGLKERILTLMADFEVPEFRQGQLKWSRFKSSRSTISREALIVAGVPVEKVDKATKVSKFWVLGLDAIKEGE